MHTISYLIDYVLVLIPHELPQPGVEAAFPNLGIAPQVPKGLSQVAQRCGSWIAEEIPLTVPIGHPCRKLVGLALRFGTTRPSLPLRSLVMRETGSYPTSEECRTIASVPRPGLEAISCTNPFLPPAQSATDMVNRFQYPPPPAPPHPPHLPRSRFAPVTAGGLALYIYLTEDHRCRRNITGHR